MKNLLLILFTIVGLSSSVMSSGEPKTLISNADVNAIMDSESSSSYILFSSYNIENKMMDFIIKNPVTMIQIFKENGELEMVVPIHSDEVSVGLTQFKKGKYKIGFIIEGVDSPQFMDIDIK